MEKKKEKHFVLTKPPPHRTHKSILTPTELISFRTCLIGMDLCWPIGGYVDVIMVAINVEIFLIWNAKRKCITTTGLEKGSL